MTDMEELRELALRSGCSSPECAKPAHRMARELLGMLPPPPAPEMPLSDESLDDVGMETQPTVIDALGVRDAGDGYVELAAVGHRTGQWFPQHVLDLTEATRLRNWLDAWIDEKIEELG